MPLRHSTERGAPSVVSFGEQPAQDAGQTRVQIWVEDVVMPTYQVGPPNRNPMFLKNRVYQGSSGRVYPYPVIDRIFDEKTDESHRVVFLENRYLKLMVMPAFGGRIQYAYDKTNGYPFIYHNRVIKPALVGLAGPWLSGGIEFNWPQHHRPGTYCPVDYTITKGSDGSMTLWLSEIEPMWHLKGTLGLTLYPDRAFVEINIRLFNPTPLPQTFHLWTNAAVHVNDSYQSIFPPDVHAVYDHGRRDVSEFPIARGEYYKVDYARGVDISWYKNIPVPTSYMAVASRYDFLGGYDHRRQAGVLHVADHHVVPGKKQWTWGCGRFGQAWDRNLTDEDGPYVELMCGVFADNQPDFAWLHPFEEKEVRQFFLPYKLIGRVVNATVHAAVSLEIEDGRARLGAYATSSYPDCVIRLRRRTECLWEQKVNLAPEAPFVAEVPLHGAAAQELRLEVVSREGDLLVEYVPERVQKNKIVPEPAAAVPEPREVRNTEALYLAGLHLEQYRHATREPEDYYREALCRDPIDVRNNNALGLLLVRRGQFVKAEPFFRAAIESQIRHNANPYEGEPHYNLGVCLRYQGRHREADAAFLKSAWNGAWQDAAFFQVAQLRAVSGDMGEALQCVQRALARNAHNQKATHLKTLVLRRMGRSAEAMETATAAIRRDPLDFGARNERVLLLSAMRRREEAAEEQAALLGQMGGDAHTHLEIAADYAHAGAYEEALDLLGRAISNADGAGRRAPGHTGAVGLPYSRPMLFYMSGYYASLQGDDSEARRYFELGSQEHADCCFPNSLDSLLALQSAMNLNPADACAAYYLGNLWYDKQQVPEAMECWQHARRAASRFPTVHRNLALAYFNEEREPAKALRSLERAFALDRTDSRVLFELDLLRKRAGLAPARRLALLRKHMNLVEQRDDLLIEFVMLLNFLGAHEEALRILTTRTFHPWEGGEGKVTGQYVVSLVELAKCCLRTADAVRAIELLERARDYPPSLGEGKLHGAQENQILYWLGIGHMQLGRGESAETCWKEASIGVKTPAPAVYYNDPNPEMIFYQGLALDRLGRRSAARERFQSLVRFGDAHLKKPVEMDYFAVSLPEFMVFDDDLKRRNEITCRVLTGLGYWGLGRRAEALRAFRTVLRLDPSHQSAMLQLRTLTGSGAVS
jgi:tetratricopeptide (TPR) repeat protein